MATSPKTARGPRGEMPSRILDVAEELVQLRGFNGFSYADVARRLGVTNASLHYHFPGKADLGIALVGRYSERFQGALAEIEQRHGAGAERLGAYASLYGEALEGRRMCLCGMLAAEYQTLPEEMRAAIVSFFDANEGWLERILAAGRDDGSLAFTGPTDERARALIGGLEGAMLVARLYGEPTRFRTTAGQLVGSLGAAAASPAPV
jgi:TetR/AcrR family transcriptional regulator, transcriptional repressor for nem operon